MFAAEAAAGPVRDPAPRMLWEWVGDFLRPAGMHIRCNAPAGEGESLPDPDTLNT